MYMFPHLTTCGFFSLVNWYRTREIDYKDELALADDPIIEAPLLHIKALKDAALPPGLGRQMGLWVPNLTLAEVDTTHWAMWEDPQGVNEILSRWLQEYFC
jgi:pimeloyl-ACP methyl ester carboxylesterase